MFKKHLSTYMIFVVEFSLTLADSWLCSIYEHEVQNIQPLHGFI
jgi:hypothetical protein